MSAVYRLFMEWLGEEFPDGGNSSSGSGYHQDDMQEAFEAGWAACYHARWEKVGGLPLGDSLKEART